MPNGHTLAELKRPLKLSDLDGEPLVSYESSLRPEYSLRRAFAAAGITPRFSCTSRDADLIKTYVRAGLGVGIFADMAFTEEDANDLHQIDAEGLFPECTTWLVLRRDRVLRARAATRAELIAPQIDQRDRQRAHAGEEPEHWRQPPYWSELQKKLIAKAA